MKAYIYIEGELKAESIYPYSTSKACDTTVHEGGIDIIINSAIESLMSTNILRTHE